jgi:endonuclease-3
MKKKKTKKIKKKTVINKMPLIDINSSARNDRLSFGLSYSPDLNTVLDKLDDLWGQEMTAPDLSHKEPLDGLILTVLSQNTNDRNRDKAFVNLKRAFPKWEMLIEAPQEEIVQAIKVAGIAKVKSGRIKVILEKVMDSFGECSLKKMYKMDKKAITDYLGSLPGVGPKTVACVLVFELNIPAFPVDTHVNRFCKRMGWVQGSYPPTVTQDIMEEAVPEERKLGAHLNIIMHGRKICSARNPQCDKCDLSDICPSALEFSSQK